MQVSVRNLQRKIKVNLRKLSEAAAQAVPLCLEHNRDQQTELSSLPEISITLVSDRRMSALHRQFLGQSGPTDVLTFQHGEIVVSVETAARNARRFGNPLARELLLYVVHGLLHLQGFDDTDALSAKKMSSVQNRILRLV
jgi:probable rRNA maturation factor